MDQVWGTFSAHMQSCSTDPQVPLSSAHPEAMADLCWLNHLWAAAHDWGDDSWSSKQQSIAAAHTQLDSLFGEAPTWEAYLAAYDALHR